MYAAGTRRCRRGRALRHESIRALRSNVVDGVDHGISPGALGRQRADIPGPRLSAKKRQHSQVAKSGDRQGDRPVPVTRLS